MVRNHIGPRVRFGQFAAGSSNESVVCAAMDPTDALLASGHVGILREVSIRASSRIASCCARLLRGLVLPTIQKRLRYLDIAQHVCRHAMQDCILPLVDEVVVGLHLREPDLFDDFGSGRRPASAGTGLPASAGEDSDTAVTDSDVGFTGRVAFCIKKTMATTTATRTGTTTATIAASTTRIPTCGFG